MRKLIVGSAIVILVAFSWHLNSFGQGVPTPKGELRVVDRSPGGWGWLVSNVFEHLIEVDKDGQLVPRLTTGWRWLNDHTLEVTLRQGVKFHNGEALDAEIVKLNWIENSRLRQPFEIGTFMNFMPGSRVDIIAPRTVRFIFPSPDGAALFKLSQMHIANRQFYHEFGWGEKNW